MEKIKTDKEWILIGAGDEGVKIANALQRKKRTVHSFVDNDKSKVGQLVDNIPVISFEKFLDIYDKYEVVVAVSKKYEKELAKQLEMSGVRKYKLLEEVYDEIEFESKIELADYKGVHEGERCFIIGTGPSLKMEDLELLKENGEVTFASNRIFKMYDKTSWRPKYYFVTDFKVISQYFEEILSINDSEVFVADIESSSECRHLDKNRLNKEGFHCFSICYREKLDNHSNRNLPCFSLDASRYVVDGGLSVTYAMLQWAVYMGFKEIYLLGVDFHYNDKSGLSNEDHVCSNYLKEGEIVNPPNLERCERAYTRAELISKEGDYRIYNATRGGKLEVFERVDFDSLFENKE